MGSIPAGDTNFRSFSKYVSILEYGRLAQLVEQRFYTAKVTGSSPVSPTLWIF